MKISLDLNRKRLFTAKISNRSKNLKRLKIQNVKIKSTTDNFLPQLQLIKLIFE